MILDYFSHQPTERKSTLSNFEEEKLIRFAKRNIASFKFQKNKIESERRKKKWILNQLNSFSVANSTKNSTKIDQIIENSSDFDLIKLTEDAIRQTYSYKYCGKEASGEIAVFSMRTPIPCKQLNDSPASKIYQSYDTQNGKPQNNNVNKNLSNGFKTNASTLAPMENKQTRLKNEVKININTRSENNNIVTQDEGYISARSINLPSSLSDKNKKILNATNQKLTQNKFFSSKKHSVMKTAAEYFPLTIGSKVADEEPIQILYNQELYKKTIKSFTKKMEELSVINQVQSYAEAGYLAQKANEKLLPAITLTNKMKQKKPREPKIERPEAKPVERKDESILEKEKVKIFLKLKNQKNKQVKTRAYSNQLDFEDSKMIASCVRLTSVNENKKTINNVSQQF